MKVLIEARKNERSELKVVIHHLIRRAAEKGAEIVIKESKGGAK